MAFRDMMRRITVDENSVFTNEQTTAKEIISSAGKDPNRYDLVQANADGTVELHPACAQIRIREGSVFETQLSSKNGL